VKEAVECLDGRGPEDLLELVLACAAHLLVQTGKAKSVEAGQKLAAKCLDSGKPRKKWDEMLRAQGANLDAMNEKLSRDSEARVVEPVKAEKSGYVSRCDARMIGEVIRDLGGGRVTKDARIDYAVGVDGIVKVGAKVKAGDVLARVHGADDAGAKGAVERVRRAFGISGEQSGGASLVAEWVG
jgi:thymidine phosphorylase